MYTQAEKGDDFQHFKEQCSKSGLFRTNTSKPTNACNYTGMNATMAFQENISYFDLSHYLLRSEINTYRDKLFREHLLCRKMTGKAYL